MKILVINNFFGPFGGAELMMSATWRLLREAGHEAYFFATDRKPYFVADYEPARFFPEHSDFDTLQGAKQKLAALPKLFYNTDAEQSLRAFLREYRPDVVHCGNLHYHLSPSVLKACKDAGIPVVLTVHDPRMMCPAGTLMLNGESYCKEHLCVTGSPLNCISHRCYDKSLAKSALVTAEFMFRSLHRQYDNVTRFVTPSEGLRQLAIQSGVAPERVSTVPNCLQEAYLDVPQPEGNGEYFLYVGRLSKEKGVNFLIDAMQGIPEGIGLHIVGAGPAEAELKAQAESLGLNNVHFLGFMGLDEIIAQYQRCIAMVMPSKWFEAFGLTAIESFACGRPVIGTRLGGLLEIVDDGVNGLLVEPESAEALHTAMQAFVTEPSLSLSMGAAGRRKAETQYAPARYLRDVLAVYGEVLQSPGLASPITNEEAIVTPSPVSKS